MKKASLVPMAMAGLISFVSMSHADTTSSTPTPDNDPEITYDRDGVALSVTMKGPFRDTPEQMAEDRRARQQAVLNKDWLLRAYEKQLQTHSITSTSMDRRANPYQEVGGNKDLSQLAGLIDYRADSTSDEPLYRTKDGQAYHGAAALRPGSSSAAPSLRSAPFGSSFLTPMVTPISAPDASGTKNFYASLPDAAVAPFNGSTPVPQLKPRSSIIPDPIDTDIETPGMIAAKTNGLTDPGASDLSLDMLPGESVEHAKAHQDNSESLLQLPMPMSAEQLHRAQATYLGVPVAKSIDPTKASATAVKPPAPPVQNDNQPVPISEMPVITPVRGPIANPYDILNR